MQAQPSPYLMQQRVMPNTQYKVWDPRSTSIENLRSTVSGVGPGTNSTRAEARLALMVLASDLRKMDLLMDMASTGGGLKWRLSALAAKLQAKLHYSRSAGQSSSDSSVSDGSAQSASSSKSIAASGKTKRWSIPVQMDMPHSANV